MSKFPKYFLRLIFLLCLLIFWSPILQAEFYKYVDDEGNIFYVDDLSGVPEKYREQVNVYREKYDDLSVEEKSQALQREDEQLRQQEELHRQEIERLQRAQAIEEEEEQRKAEAARRKLLENSETRVILEGNRLLIPVTVNNNGLEIEVNLLLDTGASQIVLNRAVADQLGIITLKKGSAQVAGGSRISTQLGKVSYVKVGPHKMKDASVLIIPHEGTPVNYSGLLGMNFLKQVEYSIDYKNQVIRWKPLSNPIAPGQ
jgi:clan AA aspartic protease (TIGR02281 family)